MIPRCEDVQAQLSDRLLGDGDPGTDAVLEAHLRGCGDCRRFLDDVVWQDLALSEEAARSDVTEILRRWRGLPAPRRSTLRKLPAARSPLPYIAAAGLLLAGLGLLIGRATARPAPLRASPVREVAAGRAEEIRAAEERRKAEERLVEIERQRERLRMAVEAAERERQEADRKRALDELARIARERYQAEAALEKARGDVRRAEEETLRRPEPPPPARAGTVAAAAAVENVAGDVRLAGSGRLERGQWIVPGQAIEAKGDGHAVLRFPDGTRVWLEPGGRIDDVSAVPAKRIALSRGAARARVEPQPSGAPMVFSTPHGEARVVGTTLRLAVDAGGAALEVVQGSVVLSTPDGQSVQVPGGHTALASLGRAPTAKPMGERTLHFQDGVSPDPFYQGSRDTALREHDPTVPGGARLSLEPDGSEPGSTGQDVVALLRWDLSAIPPGSRVISASLHVRTIDDSDHAYEISEMRRPWVEAEATWLGPTAGSTWQSPGVAGTQDRGSKALGLIGPIEAKGDLSVLLNDEGLRVVQAWVDRPASNHGLIVHGTANTDGLGFHSREYKNPSLRPRLSVTFVPARDR